MRFTVDHPIALADDRLPDSLGQVTFARAGWTQKKGVLMASDERCGRQIEDQAAIHLLVEVEIEVIERHLGSRNCACFRRRSRSRSPRRVSSSDTRQERKSMGTIGFAWACCRRGSNTAAMAPRSNLRTDTLKI